MAHRSRLLAVGARISKGTSASRVDIGLRVTVACPQVQAPGLVVGDETLSVVNELVCHQRALNLVAARCELEPACGATPATL